MPEVAAGRLVFLDESGVNTNMSRRYARSAIGQRANDAIPLNTGKSTTILSSVRLDGTIIPVFFAGAVNQERFAHYLKEHLIPTLKPGDIVIMDNLRTHKVDGVAALIQSVGAFPLYLPPYSPDLNPIEEMWSKIKAYLRKVKARVSNKLDQAIIDAFSTVSLSDISGWFEHSGYSYSKIKMLQALNTRPCWTSRILRIYFLPLTLVLVLVTTNRVQTVVSVKSSTKTL